MMVPVVETERLVLRGMVKADFPVYASVWQEPEVVRFIGGKPRSGDGKLDDVPQDCRKLGDRGVRAMGDHTQAGRRISRAVRVLYGNAGIGAGIPTLPRRRAWVLTASAHGRGYGCARRSRRRIAGSTPHPSRDEATR